MKKSGIIILLAVLAVLFFWGMGAYNGFVKKDEAVKTKWGNVQNEYQRRFDLIDNLVKTVMGYAELEGSTLEVVVNVRSKATQMSVNAENLTPESLQEFQATQGELTNALGRLLLLREAYPDLKANQNFLKLQDQLEGTENRIKEARRQFNETAQEYNSSVRQAPGNIIAGLFGFKQKPYFESEQGAEKAPEVKF